MAHVTDERAPRSAASWTHRFDVRLLVGLALAAFAVRAIPVLIGGGLYGLQGYDDGVYFGAATALVHGVLPYRDVLLLHPPGMVVLLTPFAWLGTLIGDGNAFAAARTSSMALGALNAVLVALVAGRYGRAAGLTAGGLYAVWSTASNFERATDLHAPQNMLLLISLLVLTRPGRVRPPRAALAGLCIGLAMSVELWQALSGAVLLWWVVVRAAGVGWDRLRAPVAYVASGAVAFGLVALPFFVAAPGAMLREVLLDQLGRPSVGIGIIERIRVLEGFPQLSQLPLVLRQVVPDPVVLAGAAAALALLVWTAWRCPWTRPWAVLAVVQSAAVLVTPSFFNDYPSLAAPALALVLGTGLALGVRLLTRRGWPRGLTLGGVGVLLGLLAIVSVARLEGQALPLAALERDLANARCVSADAPSLLILTGSLVRDLDNGCAVVLDPSGTSYDTDRGRLLSGPSGPARQEAPEYQGAMVDWYTSGDAALFVRAAADGLTDATWTTIRERLPGVVRRGPVSVYLAAAP